MSDIPFITVSPESLVNKKSTRNSDLDWPAKADLSELSLRAVHLLEKNKHHYVFGTKYKRA